MKLTRREFAKWAGLLAPAEAGILGGCLSQRPEMRLLASRIAMPKPFETRLPVPAVLAPVRSDGVTDYYEMTAREEMARILPASLSGPTRIWAFNGTFPGPTIEARSGRRVSLTLQNALPVPVVSHLHGGHTPPESDGYPTDLILPRVSGGNFPLSHLHDPRARITEGSREYVYPNRQRAATLWYHDHRMDFTAPQLWRGLAGFYIIRDEEEAGLGLPRGDKEIPLLLCDRSFDRDGSLLYPSLDPTLREKMGVETAYMGGVLGDVMLVNGAPWPVLEVANTRYRFRILNASNARRYELALEPAPTGAAAFTQIGSDGGLLGAPVAQHSLRIAPAERIDGVVDI